jgi:hypothetical protein
MHQPLASLLFPEYRRCLLGLLLLRPDESLNGREVARGEEAAGSHVDVQLGRDAGCRDVVEALSRAQATLGREVNPKVFGIDELATKARTEPFLREVLSCPKIFLIVKLRLQHQGCD